MSEELTKRLNLIRVEMLENLTTTTNELNVNETFIITFSIATTLAKDFLEKYDFFPDVCKSTEQMKKLKENAFMFVKEYELFSEICLKEKENG